MGQTEFKGQIGERLRSLRKGKVLNLRELSERTGGRLSVARISNYEQGRRLLPPWEAQILASALEVRASFLMCLEDTQLVISPDEEQLLRNWRALPENERLAAAQKLEVQAYQYRKALPDPKGKEKTDENPAPAPRTRRLRNPAAASRKL